MKQIKELLKKRFKDYGCKNYKELIAQDSGLTIVYVRRWFREHEMIQPLIEKSAFKVLDQQRLAHEAKIEKLSEN